MRGQTWFQPFQDDPDFDALYGQYKRLPRSQKKAALPALQERLLMQHLLLSKPATASEDYDRQAKDFAARAVQEQLATAQWKKDWKTQLKTAKVSAKTSRFLSVVQKVPKQFSKFTERYNQLASAFLERTKDMPLQARAKAWKQERTQLKDKIYQTKVVIEFFGYSEKTHTDKDRFKYNRGGSVTKIHHDEHITIPSRFAKGLPTGTLERHSEQYEAFLKALNSSGRADIVEMIRRLDSPLDHLKVAVEGRVQAAKGIKPSKRKAKSDGQAIICCNYIKARFQVDGETLRFERADEILDLEHNSDCFPVAMLQQLKPAYDNATAKARDGSTCKRNKDPLTLTLLEKWLGRQINRKDGESPEDMDAIHATLRVKATVIDPRGNVLHRYEPPAVTHHMQSHVIYVMHNNHVWAVASSSINSITQLIRDRDVITEPQPLLPPAPYMSPPSRFDAAQWMVAKDFQELVQLFANTEMESGKNYKVLYHGCIISLFQTLRKNYGYECEVRTDGKSLSALILRLQNTYTIKDFMLSDAAMEKRNLASEHYNAFAQHLCSLLNTLMERSYHSQYSANLRKCLNGFYKANLNARFMPKVPDSTAQVDRCRAYTAELVGLDKVPVFTCFDDFEAYDGHPVEPHTLYLIENTHTSVEAWLICNERYGLVSGHVLTESAIPFRILASIRPSHLSDNAAGVVVEELYKWDAPGCDVFRKRAVNIAIGMTGKRTARHEVA